MKSIKTVSIFFSLSIMLFFLHCTKNIAGSEVTNEKYTATIYLPNGRPANNATVLLVPVDYVPSTGLVKKSATMLSDLKTSTDNQGHFSVSGLADGYYNILAKQDSLVMFHDSIGISSTSLLEPINDTLNLPASLCGNVKIQPNHNVTTVIVQALGTNIYANVNSQGQFNLPMLAKGDYQLKFSTSIAEYTPKFISIGINSSKPDTLKDTISIAYTGIPVVTGIKAIFDSSNGTVRIQWDSITYSNISDFVIYKAPFDTIQSAGNLIGATMNTFFVDSSIRYLDSGFYRYKYRVAILDNSISMGAFYKFADITIHSQGGLSVQIININNDWQDNIFLNGSAVVKAQIKSPLGPITKVEWRRLLSGDSGGGLSFKDTLLQSTVYSKPINFLVDSVEVKSLAPNMAYDNLLCKATDIWGDTSVDTTNVRIYPDTAIANKTKIQIYSNQDSVYIDSIIPLVGFVNNALYPIKQIQWKLQNPDSTLQTTTFQEPVLNYSDSLRFSSNTPGLKTIYCSLIDSLNLKSSDSINILVMPR